MSKEVRIFTASEKYNRKPSGVRNRIIAMVAFAFIILTAFFLTSNYFSTISNAENLTLQRLQGIVNELATHINPDQHQRLSSRYGQVNGVSRVGQDQDYDEIHRQLAHTHKANKLNSPIYTFVRANTVTKEFKFIATSSEEPYFKHSYTSFPKETFAQLEDGGVMPLYKDEFGHWLSAFAPLKNSNGEVVGYVQADEKFDQFMSSVKETIIWNALISLAGFTVIMLGLMQFLKVTLLQEEKLSRELKVSLEETRRVSGQLAKNEIQLRENAEKLKQSNQELTDFAHIASHDLKAPIRNMQSFAQLIKRRNAKQLDAATNEQLGFIIDNANRAQQLITGLLSYSTADKDLGKPVIFPMHQAVQQAQQNLASIILDTDTTLTYDSMPILQANPTLVSQVMQNLINNGIKYNQSPNPIITVGHGVDEAKEETYFFVRDNGIGIPEQYQSKIFKMFTRLHTSGEYEGSGIGLAFCQRVVSTYGGKMWLESVAGQGATFFFTLPEATVVAKVESAELAESALA